MNEYLHILNGSKANDIDLAWILKLRLNRDAVTSMGSRRESNSTFANPPSVFYKQTVVSKKRKKDIDCIKLKGNHADVGICN